MHLTDDGVVTSEYDVIAANPVNMSIASDTSSRDDSGSVLSGSGASRHDLCWSDEKFNTRRSSGMARKHSQDSQSSENGSWQSDNSGSGVHNSYQSGHLCGLQTHPAQCRELRNVSPSHTYSNSSCSIFSRPYPATDPYSKVTDLSQSYEQTMMVHMIRKQKTIAHYYELLEKGIRADNNYKNLKSCYQDIVPDRQSAQDRQSVPSSPATEYSSTTSTCSPEVTRLSSSDSGVSSAPPRLSEPNWRSQTDTVLPDNHFYHPVNVPYTGRTNSPGTRNGFPHLDLYAYDVSDGTRVRNGLTPGALQTRALSADFGRGKIPDFPCHRAALGEAISDPNTPIQAGDRKWLEAKWQVHLDGVVSARKSLSKMFGLTSLPGSDPDGGPRASEPSPVRSRRVEPSSDFRRPLTRSCSAPNQLDQWTDDDDDDRISDNDDYGFLSHPGFMHMHAPGAGGKLNKCSSTSSTGMQKAKSPSTGRRMVPKRWRRIKSSASSKHISIWKPEGGCIWSCKNGRQLTLTPVSLMTLTEVERVTLQKIAQAKLQALSLGCPVPIPKDWNREKRSKKSTFSSLRKRTASTSSVEASKCKGNKDLGGVFGIPLGKCIANDQEIRRRKSSSITGEHENTPTHTPRHTRKSSRTSATASLESLSESGSRDQDSNLLDALSLSTTAPLESRLDMAAAPLSVHAPQVPYIVTTCCKHLETYGLRVLGIFRIGSSKKRSKQLREEIDQCPDIKLNESHNPHDVAALLKEYFRDLPDPLFTRDLYSAFIATRKMKDSRQRLRALTLLLCLLPTPNRDTLWALLRFLSIVVQHSTDAITETGQLLPGNKMDSTNLATLFGPNLLHKAKGGEFQVESIDRAEERKEIISVIKELIDHHESVFKLPPEIQDDLYRRLLETNPEALDYILKRRGQRKPRTEMEHENSTSSLLDDSEGSSMPHSPSYSSENDLGYPRSFAEAMQLCSAESSPLVKPSASQPQLRVVPSEGPAVYQTSPSPVTTPRIHRAEGRNRSDNSLPESVQHLPASYRLSAPDTSAWFHGSRSASPASPRISPSPKAMKAGTPEPQIRITKSESPDKCVQPSTKVASNHQGRISVGVPHGPGPGGHRSKHKNTLTVPVPCSRSKSTESCSSVGSSSGYQGGSSRSGTNSPMTPDSGSTGHKRWYLETPPESPKEDTCSPFHRTSSTHRPLGFNVPNHCSTSSPSPSPAARKNTSPTSPSSHSARPENARGGSSASTSVHWQKERWCHWEKLTKQHSEEQQEQETLV